MYLSTRFSVHYLDPKVHSTLYSFVLICTHSLHLSSLLQLCLNFFYNYVSHPSSLLYRIAPEWLVGKNYSEKALIVSFRCSEILRETFGILLSLVIRSTVVPPYLWESKVCTADYAERDRSPAPAVLQTKAVHTGQLSAWLAGRESLKSKSI